jgi:predicted nucleotide-binding protein (sugar kinase/HSP70/actin superfamily)
VEEETPALRDMFWAHGQTNLRAAHQVRRTPGLYSVYCSNYSCGPDSFVLHFYAYVMQGKPYAIIETDGHSGDAGTKTRIEAFLHCVQGDRTLPARDAPRDLRHLQAERTTLAEVRARGDRLLIPRMGPAAEAVAACVRAAGVPAESLPMPDRQALKMGRRFTSGKECLPMSLTLGSLLQRLEREPDPTRTFSFLMATAAGPCRFGAYHLLHRIVVERLGWADRVRFWSPSDAGYFDGLPPGFEALVCSAFMGSDVLLEALYDARPVERMPGAAAEIYERRHRELIALLERQPVAELSTARALAEIATRRLFGVRDLLRGAAREFGSVRGRREMPTVLVLGEVYVRCDPFANDFVIDRLEARGLRCRFAPFNEWIEYTDTWNEMIGVTTGLAGWLKPRLRSRIQESAYRAAADILGWPPRTRVRDSLRVAAPYVRAELSGEAVLTVGTAVHEWREGLIDGAVAVGPFECMPTKVASSQFFHVAEREGMPSLTISLNGEPMDLEGLDSFAYEVRARWKSRRHRPGCEDAASAGRSRTSAAAT